MTPENLLTEWSRLLVESLADVGLRHVVISPGSRSTPLACAALGSPRLDCVSIVDERSAGFYALGMARITRRASAVLCTSGSAAANYFPAVVEAKMARIPLLIITADRPPELQDCGAPQTLDQIKIYGDYVRSFVELGMPDASPAALVGLRRRALQSWFETVAAAPGAVHVNVRARKPLEPARAASVAAEELTRRVNELLSAPATRASESRTVASDEGIAAIAADCAKDERGIIVCGPSAAGSAGFGAAVARLAEVSGFPVYAEATSQLRFDGTAELAPALTLDGLDVLLRTNAFREAFRPRVVVQVGEPPTSGAWERLLAARPELVRHVIAPHGWPDPQGTARSLVVADVADTLSRLAAAIGSRRGARNGSAWTEFLAHANTEAWGAVAEVLTTQTSLSEGAAVRTVLEALPTGAVLAIGNSLPVRHLDAFCPARPSANLVVCAQRGVSGIDGLVSGAAGAASAAARPTALIVGDVSALHDLGGFAAAAAVRVPFIVVILNNDGGRIFEQLPLANAGLDPAALRFWTTPHGARFDGIARLFRVRHQTVSTLPELRAALDANLQRSGCAVIEVTVPPHGALELSASISARLENAVGPLVTATELG